MAHGSDNGFCAPAMIQPIARRADDRKNGETIEARATGRSRESFTLNPPHLPSHVVACETSDSLTLQRNGVGCQDEVVAQWARRPRDQAANAHPVASG